MKTILLSAVALVALAAPVPASAQHGGHNPRSGHTAHPPAPPAASGRPARARRAAPVKRRAPARRSAPAARRSAATPPAVQPALDHSTHQVPPGIQAAPAPAAPATIDHSTHQAQDAPQGAPMGESAMDHSTHQERESSPGEAMNHIAHPASGPEASGAMPRMTGALGSYPMGREASGTAWQPDASRHAGLHAVAGGWTLMGHLALNAVYDWQEGPRGDEMAFVGGMAMGMARRDAGDGSLQFRAMLSPEPLMGRRGYPLHLASGETADGVTALVDRQHPHDLFVELSASYSHRFSESASAFLYAGLPGEPAFGPPAFMHRLSILDSPEAPISHHWLDSTHIAFGVVTAGLVVGDFKIEASRFNGREPDQHRYDIETGPLDSTALRVAWNPTGNLSLQGSWAHLVSPEQLEPDENSTRWSASGIYTRALGEEAWWSTTLAWGRRSGGHEQFDAFVLESSAGIRLWTLFGRAEYTENNELISVGGHHGPTFNVGKVSAGVIRDFRVAPAVRLGVGALYTFNFVPRTLEALYGGHPNGAMAFIRLKVE